MRRLFSRAFVLAIATVPAATVLSTASAAPLYPEHVIHSANSGHCLTAQGNDNNAPVFQYTCTGLADQTWIEIPFGPGNAEHYELQNENSHKCLVSQDHGNNSPAFQYDCGHLDAVWTKLGDVDSAGRYPLHNVASGRCLVVQGFAPGSQAFTYDCNDQFADQLWFD